MPENKINDEAEYVAPDFVEGRLYDMSRSQKRWLLIWCVLGLIIIFAARTLWIKAFGPVFVGVGFLGAWTFNEGPGYLIPVDYLSSRKIRKNQGFVEAGSSDHGTKPLAPPLKFGTASIYLGSEDVDGPLARELKAPLPTGLLTPENGETFTFYVLYGGSLGPSLDWDERMAFEQRVLDVISGGAALVGYEESDLTFAPIVSGRPHNPHPSVASLTDLDLHPDFLDPEPGTMEASMADVLNSRILDNAWNGRDVISGYAFTLKAPAEWKAALKEGTAIPNDAVLESNLALLADHVVNGLKAVGVEDPRCINLLELDEFIRLQRTIAKVGELHDFLFQRRERFKTMSIQDVIKELEESDPWPSGHIRLGKDYLSMDGTYFSVYRTISFKGRRRFRPGSMLSLQFPAKARWVTTTCCGDVISAATQEDKMTRSIVWSKAVIASKDESSKYMSERERDDRGRMEQLQSRFYREDAPVYRHGRYVLVAAPSRQALRRNRKFVVGAHSQRLIDLKLIKLESRQLRAFTNALLGVNT